MNVELFKMYRKCRTSKPFMVVGRDAECSLSAAKTILAFRKAEAEGRVRLRMEPEVEDYFSVYGSTGSPAHYRETKEIIERLGCWWTCSEYLDEDGEWTMADSCGMHTGYEDPLDPFENGYIVQEMQAALDALEQEVMELP